MMTQHGLAGLASKRGIERDMVDRLFALQSALPAIKQIRLATLVEK
jgi:hypothetical protein